MAIGDKKSLLQPSSTQAQQYRLQYSNLAPGGVVPPTQTGGLSAPANARPAVSAFVQAPAPVSLQAPATIPPPPPAPAPAPAPVISNPPIIYKSSTIFSTGDNSSYFSVTASSDAFADYNFHSTGSYEIAFLGTPADFQGSTKRVLFHTYSGSFVSQSIEIYFQNGHIAIEYRDSGRVARYTKDLNIPYFKTRYGKQGNGHTYFKIKKQKNHTNLAPGLSFHDLNIGKDVLPMEVNNDLSPIPISFNIAGNTNFHIGGTATTALTGSSYSGSLQFITFKGPEPFMNQGQIVGVCDATLLPQAVSPQVRTFSFAKPGISVEILPGSLASDMNTYVIGGSGWQDIGASGYY